MTRRSTTRRRRRHGFLWLRREPTHFLDLPIDEQLDWCRDFLQGFVDDIKEHEMNPDASPHGVRRYWRLDAPGDRTRPRPTDINEHGT